MSPRAYSLGRRALAVEETRQRVIEAAMAAYLDLGFSGASMQAVARRADVAAGTVHYHFASREALLEAAMARILEDLSLPDAARFRGPADVRIRDLFVEVYAFYARSSRWYPLFERDRGREPALARAEQDFYARFQRLVTTVAGEHATDPHVMTVIFALLTPGTLAALQRGGHSTAQAAELACELLLPWLSTRRTT